MSKSSGTTVRQADNSQFITSQTFAGETGSAIGWRERVRLQPLAEAAWERERARRREQADG